MGNWEAWPQGKEHALGITAQVTLRNLKWDDLKTFSRRKKNIINQKCLYRYKQELGSLKGPKCLLTKHKSLWSLHFCHPHPTSQSSLSCRLQLKDGQWGHWVRNTDVSCQSYLSFCVQLGVFEVSVPTSCTTVTLSPPWDKRVLLILHPTQNARSLIWGVKCSSQCWMEQGVMLTSFPKELLGVGWGSHLRTASSWSLFGKCGIFLSFRVTGTYYHKISETLILGAWCFSLALGKS